MPNRLADATSPYLQQHADNPVDWWEWSPEAFAEAERRGCRCCCLSGMPRVTGANDLTQPGSPDLACCRTVPIRARVVSEQKAEDVSPKPGDWRACRVVAWYRPNCTEET